MARVNDVSDPSYIAAVGEKNVATTHTQRVARRSGWRWSVAFVGVILFPFMIWGDEIQFQWRVRRALNGEIEYVEFQPNVDWPKQRLTDANKLDSLKRWIFSTRSEVSFRSAPPPISGEFRFVFHGGREVVIKHSAMRNRIDGEHWPDPRSDIRLLFNGHIRLGPTANLAELLDIEDKTISRSTE